MRKTREEMEIDIGVALTGSMASSVVIILKYVAILLLDIRDELSELNDRAAKQTREMERQTRMEKKRA